jgi:hypothetical protein
VGTTELNEPRVPLSKPSSSGCPRLQGVAVAVVVDVDVGVDVGGVPVTVGVAVGGVPVTVAVGVGASRVRLSMTLPLLAMNWNVILLVVASTRMAP